MKACSAYYNALNIKMFMFGINFRFFVHLHSFIKLMDFRKAEFCISWI